VSTRIYVIADANTKEERLIRASTQSQAIRFASRTAFDVHVATQDDLVALLQKVKVEDGTGAE
jgi:hypothetical protein